MSLFLRADRRHHPRRSGGDLELLVAGHKARLVDWSFGGIGVSLESGAALAIPDEVDICVEDRTAGTRETVIGRVRRVAGPGVFGIAFADDGKTGVALLLKVLGNRAATIAN